MSLMKRGARGRVGRLVMTGVVLAAVSGCGAIRRGMESAGEEPPPDPEAIIVTVRNNLTPPTTLTVYVITDSGTRTRLGTATGSTNERFEVDVPPVGRARFYARTDDGREVASNPVSLRPRQQLEWDVFTNVVTERYGDASSSLTRTGASARGR